MSEYVVNFDECNAMNPFERVWMHAFEAQKMTLSIVDMDPNAVIPEHSHPHEQIGYMVSGTAEFVIAGKSYQVRAGQMWRLPGGTPHKVVTGPEPIRAIDVFYPIREDMRPKKP